MAEEKQGQFTLAKSTGSGEDERGAYDLIPLSMVKGGALKPVKVYKKPMKHVVNSSAPSPRGWYKNKVENARTRPRPCYTEALLTTPYGGFCHVGCRFCYVDNGTRGYRATGIPTVNPEYPDYMARSVAKMNVTGAAYMSSFAEPFQILEGHYHVTQRLTQVFLDNNVPIFYLSRLIPPQWAIDALLANPYSYMQWSVNTSNDEDYKKMSPGSYHIQDVLASVQNLTSQGIFCSFQCNPVLPGITTLEELVELINLGAQAGLKHIIFKFAEQVFNNRNLLIQRLKAGRLDGVDAFDGVFTQKIGGVYTVDQDIRVEWLNTLLEATRQAGITMSTCYEYYDDGDAGANLAPYFTTSDQCHGRGIPIHYRPEPGAPFQPLPGCYRKGCLYCADHGTQACQNEQLLEARALEYKDLKAITIDPAAVDDRNWDNPDSCMSPEEIVNNPRDYYGNPDFITDMEMWE